MHERSELLGCVCIILFLYLVYWKDRVRLPCHTFKILGILVNKCSLRYIFGGGEHSFHRVVGAVKLWGQEMIRDKAQGPKVVMEGKIGV